MELQHAVAGSLTSKDMAGFNDAAAVPSPPAGNELSEALRKHFIFAMECLHEESRDIARCACGWASEKEPTMYAAGAKWREHVLAVVSAQASDREAEPGAMGQSPASPEETEA